MNKSNIDYLKHAADLINRPGYTLNIVTGCKHGCEWCYARRMVEHGRLSSPCDEPGCSGGVIHDHEKPLDDCPKCKGHSRIYHPSYPYGFAPTFHPERIKAIGGKPKLIFLNDMGDVGGDWSWRLVNASSLFKPERIAGQIKDFATLNPQHIILLLTKNPSWYRYAEWPDNVWCGFSATNLSELQARLGVMVELKKNGVYQHCWASLEPWLDECDPCCYETDAWLVIGGQSGPNAQPVSVPTLKWLLNDTVQATRFTKANALARDEILVPVPREYPAEWKVTNAT